MHPRRTRFMNLSLEEQYDLMRNINLPARDKNNLIFLLSRTDEEMEEFLNGASVDDINYAGELFAAANMELDRYLKSARKEIRDEFENVDVTDTSEATDYLKKFMLKGDYDGNAKAGKQI